MDNWNENDIADLTGNLVIVTGGNSGLGYETVRVSAEHGAEVIIASRNLDRGNAALVKMKRKSPNIDVNVRHLDLSDLVSVEQFSEGIKENYTHLNYLFNNAGTMMVPYGLTKQGFELQFGVNHLGHFALTGKLLPLIMSTKGSRVITVSSNAHRSGYINFDDLQMKNSYNRSGAYSRSKVANLFFAYELQRKFEQYNIDSLSLASHPGLSGTNLATQQDGMIRNGLLKVITRALLPLFSQSAYKGALTQIRAAYDQQAQGGEFYGPHKGMRGKPVKVESTSYSQDKSVAAQLWEVSEELTGIIYNFAG